ncbi:MAG: GNAT family N-acetyltransferase [Clostridiales bacterium]|nr:GNAT family N-acetyltransferase [Clostridiales bacterium]
MTVRYAQNADLPEIKRIWDVCFPDDKLFGEWYFHNVWKAENTLVCIVENKLAAMLQMLSAQIEYGDDACKATYIYGVGTRPEFRRRGLADMLLNASFEEDRKRNIPLSILIPQEQWLFDFYKKFSYLPVFKSKKIYLNDINQDEKITVRPIQNRDIEKFAMLYKKNTLDRAHLIRSVEDALMIFRYFTENGAIALCAEEKDQIVATGFGYRNKQTLVLQELLMEDHTQLKQVVSEMCRNCSCNCAEISLIPDGRNDTPFACARVASWSNLSLPWDKAYLNLFYN